MHPADKQWWFEHSGDYVLGLLSDADRLVFERIMQVDPDVTKLVDDWRAKLYPITEAVPPIDPPAHILESLTNNLPAQPNPKSNELSDTQRLTPIDDNDPETMRLAEAQAEVVADGTAFQRLLEQKQTLLDRNEKSANGWRSYAGLATVACIFTGVLGWIGYQGLLGNNAADSASSVNSSNAETSTPFDAISIVEDASAKPLWVVDTLTADKLLRITAISPPELEQGKAFELWINNNDRTVTSMGLLPAAANESVLIKVDDIDPSAQAFGVSVENETGSTTDAPSGPLIYRGLIEKLSLVTP